MENKTRIKNIVEQKGKKKEGRGKLLGRKEGNKERKKITGKESRKDKKGI